MNVYLTTLGCRLNEAEIERWAREFRAAGHAVTDDLQLAHVIVLNSCAVTAEAARKSRQFVNRLHRRNPQASLVLTGCYATLEPEQARRLLGVDAVLSNTDKEELVDFVEQHVDWRLMPQQAMEPDNGHPVAAARTRAFIKVQDGCRNQCTYCIVTIARGHERSRPIAEVVAEIRSLHRAGFQEVVLTGVHLGGYGHDQGSDLRALVQAVLEDTGVPRVRLSSLEPWDLPSGFFDLWQNPRLMPHLHLPLQSGCDATLRRMARRCSTASYAALVAEARATIPDLTLTTDLIVGFPGETEAEWQATVDFVQQIGFAHMHIFSFSPRQGTPAARLPGMVPNAIKKQRSVQMHALAARMKSTFLHQALGQHRPVLWEGEGRLVNARQRRWGGYTDNYLRVEMITPADMSLGNVISRVELSDLLGDPPDRLQARWQEPYGGYVRVRGEAAEA